jgi:hypothetical protein
MKGNIMNTAKTSVFEKFMSAIFGSSKKKAESKPKESSANQDGYPNNDNPFAFNADADPFLEQQKMMNAAKDKE